MQLKDGSAYILGSIVTVYITQLYTTGGGDGESPSSASGSTASRPAATAAAGDSDRKAREHPIFLSLTHTVEEGQRQKRRQRSSLLFG